MPAIIVPSRWLTKPTQACDVDLSNPLSRDLLGMFAHGMPAFGSTSHPTIVGNIKATPTLVGDAWTGAYQNSNNYVSLPRIFTKTSGPFAFEAFCIVKQFQTAVYPYITGLISTYQSSTLHGAMLRFGNGTSANSLLPFFGFVTSYPTEVNVLGLYSLPTNAPIHLIGSYDGSTLSLFYNGMLVNQASYSGSYANTSNTFTALCSDFVSADLSQNRCLNGSLFLARIYNRSIDEFEAAELARAPWQLYKPRHRRLYFFPSGAIRYGRPISDESVQWTPSTGSVNYALLADEDSGTYIYATGSAVDVYRCTAMDTSQATNPQINFEVPSGFTPSGTLTVQLWQGNPSSGTKIAERVIVDPTAGQTYTADVTGNITDGSDLWWRVVSS